MSSILLLALLVFPPGEEGLRLDMESCLRIAREKNHQLATSRLVLEQARLTRHKAWVERFLPRLDLEMTVPSLREYTTQQLDAESGEFLMYDRESRLFSSGLSLKLPLPTDGSLTVDFTGRRWEDFPRDEANVYDPTYTSTLSFTFEQPILDRSTGKEIALRKANINYEQALLSYQKELLDLDYRVAGVFLSAVRAQEQARIDSLELEVARQNADLSRRKRRSGLLSEGDVLELELQEATTKAACISSNAAKIQHAEELLLLLGLPMDISVELVVPPPPVEPEISLERALDLALARRREVKSHRLSLDLASLTIEQARQSNGPQINLTVGLDLVSRGTALEPAWNNATREHSISLGITLPLVQFGRGSIDVRKAELSRDQELLGVESTEQEVVSEVRRVVRDVGTVLERKKVLAQALHVAEENYRIAKARFDTGSISSQRLLDAQLSLFRSRTNLLATRVDLDLALRRLRRVTLARLDELVEDPAS